MPVMTSHCVCYTFIIEYSNIKTHFNHNIVHLTNEGGICYCWKWSVWYWMAYLLCSIMRPNGLIIWPDLIDLLFWLYTWGFISKTWPKPWIISIYWRRFKNWHSKWPLLLVPGIVVTMMKYEYPAPALPAHGNEVCVAWFSRS